MKHAELQSHGKIRHSTLAGQMACKECVSRASGRGAICQHTSIYNMSTIAGQADSRRMAEMMETQCAGDATGGVVYRLRLELMESKSRVCLYARFGALL